MKNKALFIFGVILVWGSISMLKQGLEELVYGTQSKSWPTTTAIIISSGIRSYADGYVVDILYEYTIEGEKYESNRLSFKSSSSITHCTAKQIETTYQPGNKVRIFVHPNQADLSVIESGVAGPTYALVILGGLAGMIGIAICASEILMIGKRTNRCTLQNASAF